MCTGREWTSLGSPFHTWADQSILHHPGVQERPDELQQPLVLDSFSGLPQQFVVIDSIKGKHDTLPIISTFRSELPSSVLAIHSKADHSMFLDRFIAKVDCISF